MILRLSDSLSRGLVVLATLVVGSWLSFYGIRAGIARFGSDGDSAKWLELAVRLEPENPNYWHSLGRYEQYNLEQPDSARARECYRTAIRLNPLATDAWLDLGTAYELDGDIAGARAAYVQAKNSYPASAEVSWRYGNFLLRQGQEHQAYAELRRAIDADPRRAAAAFSRVFRTNPDLHVILGELLPPKQSVYVGAITEAANEGQLAAAKMVWAQLLTVHPRLEVRDVDGLVSRLLAAGEFTEARGIWDQGVATMNLPPLLQPQGTEVWDPSFESGISAAAFAWRFERITQGVSIALDESEKLSGNRSLRLSFDGKHNPNLDAACALAIVQPGTSYLFSGWIKTRQITGDQGIAFRISSVEDSNAGSIKTPSFRGTNPWTLAQENWTAGLNSHRAVICIIREPSENPEVRISGSAWVDDVNLIPETAERHKP